MHTNDRTVIAEKKPIISGTLLWSPPAGGGPCGFAMIFEVRYDLTPYNEDPEIGLEVLIESPYSLKGQFLQLSIN